MYNQMYKVFNQNNHKFSTAALIASIWWMRRDVNNLSEDEIDALIDDASALIRVFKRHEDDALSMDKICDDFITHLNNSYYSYKQDASLNSDVVRIKQYIQNSMVMFTEDPYDLAYALSQTCAEDLLEQAIAIHIILRLAQMKMDYDHTIWIVAIMARWLHSASFVGTWVYAYAECMDAI